MNKLEKEVVLDNAEDTSKQEPKQTEKKEKKVKKEKKPRESKVGRKVKETTSELKKVSWLSFGQICKRTGIVIGFVLIFTLVLFGIDRLLSLLYSLIV